MRKEVVENLAELIEHALEPYVDALVKTVLGQETSLSEAKLYSLIGLACAQAEISVRKMIKQINEKLRSGEYADVRELIRRNPQVVEKAADHVAKHLKHTLRKMIREELNRVAMEKQTRKPK
jgi:hypothetical protein